MRIGELAARAGVSVRSLRYYEQQGLLTSTRTPGGQRQYTEQDVDRVRLVQGLYAADLSSRTIAELLPCTDSPSTRNSDAALERLARERERITAQIDELLRARDALDEMAAVARAHRESLLRPAPAADGPAVLQDSTPHSSCRTRHSPTRRSATSRPRR
ncbi:MerR family transcriptional regulator [Streptomyces sp. NPDC093586]|uniref:MerR family transcriptional regulator n=1 Tax=Streptomyces sp. NPDC093586 TaxID=3366042 RepID=UPI00380DC43F